MTATYGTAFYDVIRAGSQSSAAAVVPMLVELFEPASVIDVGCGEGHWGKAFEDCGVADVLGVDGHDGAAAVIPYQQVDLANDQTVNGSYDLAVCLEVAEHLPPERAEPFVSLLCSLAPVVVFSAAVPGQGGHGHLNEQPPRYWADLFEARGYSVSGALRWAIWDDDRVENWYRQNLLVCVAAPPMRLSGLFDGPAAEPHHVIHPVLFDARRH